MRRIFLAAAALFLAISGARGDSFSSPVTPAVTTFDVAMPADARLIFRGALAISPVDSDFGGLSGLLYDGGEALLISDRARWTRLAPEFQDGRLTGVTALSNAPVLDASGAPASGRGWDAEGLARLPDGRLLVSFEGDHRVQIFEDPTAPAGAEWRADAWEQFSSNSGLESLAVSPSGATWAIRERSGDRARPFPVFVSQQDGSWVEKNLPRDGDYLPTGADFGPDGWLYIVERDFGFLSGFKTRIRRARWGVDAAPKEIQTLATFPSAAGLDNLEGIAVYVADGEVRLLLVSDDNFTLFQRNVLASFALAQP